MKLGLTSASPVLVLAAAMALFLPTAAFVNARVWLPSEGVAIEADPPGDPGGLVLRPLVPGSSGIERGDVLLEINGRPVDRWLIEASSLRTALGLPGSTELTFTVLRQETLRQVPVPVSAYPVSEAFRKNWSAYLYLIYLEAISLLIFVRRPRLPAAQLFLLLCTAILGSGGIFFLGLQPSDLLRGWMLGLWFWGVILLYALLSAGLVHFALVFPSAASSLKQRPWLLIPIYAGVWLPYLALLALGWPEAATPSARLLLIERAAGAFTATYFPAFLLITIFRYRRTFSARERRQVRWGIWGSLVAIVPWLALSVFPGLLGLPAVIGSPWVGILWWILPTTFAISILRANAFDIDVLINRTIVYTALTGALALVYFSSVILSQQIFPARSSISIVLSTLAVAALFSPLRRRIQDAIDRRFYRRKYDAEQALAQFAASVRDEADVDALTARLLTVVRDTVQPDGATLWLVSPRSKEYL